MVKTPPVNAGEATDAGSVRGSGRYTGGGNGNPLPYSCLENPHGQWSLVGYNPWGLRVGPTERLSTHKHTGHLGSPSDAEMPALKHSTAALAGTIIERFRMEGNFGNDLPSPAAPNHSF